MFKTLDEAVAMIKKLRGQRGALFLALEESMVLIEIAALEEGLRELRREQQPPTRAARDRLERAQLAMEEVKQSMREEKRGT